MSIRNLTAAVVATALVACQRSESRTGSPADSAATARGNRSAGSLEGANRPSSTSTAGAMQMPGMMSAATMDSMETHMRMMDGMTGEQMKAMLPAHRQMLANMLSQMNQEMRSMNMSGDPQWTATADSIRQDLIHMPERSPQELKRAMPAHHARITRLMKMHRKMTQKM